MRRTRGYSELLGAGLIDGAIGTMVTYATMPVSMLVSLRMLFAGAALGVVVAVRRDWRALVADKATSARLLICGVALALNLLSYFIAIRRTGVAVAIFLSYLAPVYVAFVAPYLEGGRTEKAVWLALGVGLGGMALILVPGLDGESMQLTASGLAFAMLAGLMYAVYLIVGKQLRRRGCTPPASSSPCASWPPCCSCRSAWRSRPGLTSRPATWAWQRSWAWSAPPCRSA